MLVYRLHSSRYPASSGKGAAITGGRWNRKGTEAIYAASSRSLAVLEVLVHYSVLPWDFVMTEIDIPEEVKIVEVESSAWARNNLAWPNLPISKSQEIASLVGAVVLSVPSAVVPIDRNYVLYPNHPEFRSIEFRDPVPFRFDPRLMR